MVDFDITLERNEYSAGETAKGTLVISAEKDFKVRGFEFSVSGEERIELKLEDSTYKESNIFFSKDLSHFLNSIGTKVGEDDDNNMLEVAGGNWKVPFDFTIPVYALESYEGVYAKIVYKIKTTVNRAWREDVDADLSFTVFNHKRQYIKFERAITEEIIEKRESEEIIERREIPIRLELGEKEDDNNTFSPGETIRGKINLENAQTLSIRKIEIILGAIEFVQAQGVKKRTEIHPKYKEKIEWKQAGNNSTIVPFEIHIPKEIRRSYLGEYSEYYCLLEVKVDIPWSDDFYDRAIIQII
jgi:hypothetical protein